MSDTRTLDEVIGWLMDEGHLPSFCTACYRAGRTGDRFMEFCKSGQIQDFCQPNALLTLGEYLCDYASPAVAEKGWKMIDTELARVPDDRRRALAADYLARVRTGRARLPVLGGVRMSLNDTPSGERAHIVFFGVRNAGKSSLVNALTNQTVSVVSDVAGHHHRPGAQSHGTGAGRSRAHC